MVWVVDWQVSLSVEFMASSMERLLVKTESNSDMNPKKLEVRQHNGLQPLQLLAIGGFNQKVLGFSIDSRSPIS